MRFAALAFAALLLPSAAHAGFSVCNKAARPASVALGLFDGTGWMSEGWWIVQPKTCARLLSGTLDARYYYLYATDGHSGTWAGAKNFCVSTARFAVAGRANCAERGYDKRGFFQVDTGRAPDYTQSLSD